MCLGGTDVQERPSPWGAREGAGDGASRSSRSRGGHPGGLPCLSAETGSGRTELQWPNCEEEIGEEEEWAFV